MEGSGGGAEGGGPRLGEDDVPAALVNISMHECRDYSCSSLSFTATVV